MRSTDGGHLSAALSPQAATSGVEGDGTARRPIRILQVAKYFHPDRGGIETVTGSLSRALPLHAITADVLCFGRDREYSGYDYPFRVQRARTIHLLRDRPLSLEYVRLLRRAEAEYDAALLHLPNPLGAVAVLTGWRRPFVILWHADIVGYGVAGRLLRPLERALVARAAGVIVPTPAHVEGSYLARELGPKATVIPYPFDAQRLFGKPMPAQALDAIEAFVGRRLLVLTLGRLVPYKGIDVLIEAARNLSDDVAVCVVGSGPLRSRLLDRIARLGLGGRVLLAGEVPDEALPALLKRTHVMVLPSVTRAEMYGMSQVEAMAFGKPVVSTGIPGSGVPYVNLDGQTGLVVAPNDPRLLAAALNALCSDPALYARLANGASRRFREVYGSPLSARRYADVLRTAIG